MKLATDVLAVLSGMAFEGNLARITGGQLDRKLYERTNKALEALGGKWNRAKKAHVFDGDAAARVDGAIVAGEVTTAAELNYFPTPAALARELVARADVRPGMHALEPSAGEGAIAMALREVGAAVSCVEIDARRAAALRGLGFPVDECDFVRDLPWGESIFDRVVMNPPFAKGQDVEHVRLAFATLRPGGRLVSVMSGGITFREDRRTTDFRAWVDARRGTIEPLPAQSFRASGTDVSTVVVTLAAGPR